MAIDRAARERSSYPERPYWLARLRRAVWLLVAVALADLLLLAVGWIDPLGAIASFAVVIAAMAFFPADVVAAGEMTPARAQTIDGLMGGTRRFAQSLPHPCFVLAADGTVLYANDRAADIFDVHVGELLLFRLRHPELVAAFGRVSRGGGPQQVQFVERIPTERTFSAWFAPLDETPGHENYVLILDDLTEARATERMRADFVANASHELRTPLASLSGFVETLLGPAKEDPVARARFLPMMHEQAQRMSRLIDDLLSLSRIEMRAHVLPRDRVDLVKLLRHVVDTLMPLSEDLGVRIETELPDEAIVVFGDRDELVQVFNNLIENACKYGQSGERVVIGLKQNDGRCVVTVTDFGPGIAPEHLPRLTERFYRVDADASRRHRGTGLGLAIVKHIVTRHRARLQIESQPGQGAKFSVLFPAADTIVNGTQKSVSDQNVIPS